METSNLEKLIEELKKMEKENPNDYDFGNKMRKFIYEYLKKS